MADVLAAVKNFQTDPGEGAHAAWHAAGFAIQLFHKNHAGLKAAAVNDPLVAAKLAEVVALAPTATTEGVAAIDWNLIKPWAKKLLELLIMVLD